LIDQATEEIPLPAVVELVSEREDVSDLCDEIANLDAGYPRLFGDFAKNRFLEGLPSLAETTRRLQEFMTCDGVPANGSSLVRGRLRTAASSTGS
jgi:hypothetical protein